MCCRIMYSGSLACVRARVRLVCLPSIDQNKLCLFSVIRTSCFLVVFLATGLHDCIGGRDGGGGTACLEPSRQWVKFSSQNADEAMAGCRPRQGITAVPPAGGITEGLGTVHVWLSGQCLLTGTTEKTGAAAVQQQLPEAPHSAATKLSPTVFESRLTRSRLAHRHTYKASPGPKFIPRWEPPTEGRRAPRPARDSRRPVKVHWLGQNLARGNSTQEAIVCLPFSPGNVFV